MGRKIEILLCSMLILLMVTGNTVQAAEKGREQTEEQIRLESVTAYMPQMKAYCYLDKKPDKKEVQASYGKEALTVKKVMPYQESKEGTLYYLLLDQSGSLSETDFEQIKNSVIAFSKRMKENDRLTIITFGDEVQILCEDQTVKESIAEKVRALTNTDGNTKLFEAIQKTAEIADQKENAGKRKIAVAFTDGEDFSENTSTQKEACQALQKKSIPLYTMAVRQRKNQNDNPYISSMGEFARSTGGIQEVFSGKELEEKLQQLQELFEQAYVIRCEATSNQVTYKPELFVFNISDDKVVSGEVTTRYYHKDHKKPTVSVRKSGSRKLELTFSEPVMHAQKVENYEITVNGKVPLAVYTAGYTGDTKEKVVLTFQKELQNGKYRIRFSGISDRSMEKNPIKKSCTFEIKEQSSINRKILIGIIMVIAGFICILVIWQKQKKKRVSKEKYDNTTESVSLLSAEPIQKHHVRLQKEKVPGKHIIFELQGVQSQTTVIDAEIVKSLIVGRADICDIYMDDASMSKQHFVIYDKKDGFYIEDLQSTNGTLVNGKKIHTQSRLQKGDRIQAGEVQMTVRW